MAASSEIRFKIGADTAALSKEFSALPDKARNVGDRVRSAFGQLLPRKDAAASFSVFEEAFAKAEQQALSLARTQQESTRKSAAESAAVFEKQLRAAEELKAAQDALATAKKRTAYDEANTVGRIKITTGELAGLARQRNALGQGTVERLKIELQIEEKLATLRRLQRTQGAANTALLPNAAQVEAKANGLLATIRRKFSGAGLAQGLLQGIGIGSVQAIADTIIRPFELGYERAKDMLGVTTRLREITTAEITAGAGRNVVLRETKREINDLNTDIALQRQLVADLNGNPLTFTNPTSLGMLREAEQTLGNLIVRQAELTSKLTTEQKIRERVSREGAREENTLFEIHEAELRNSGERVKLQIRLNALIADYNRLAKRGDAPTAAADANVGKQFEIQRQLAILDKQAREQSSATLSGLGQSVAGTRTGGRSEAQRLADRGASRLSAAESAAMSGASPAYIAALSAQANRDFKTAGGKVSTATSGVAKGDANDLGNQLIAANQTLKNIDKNLAPTKIPVR